jgi:hypothetical protein
MKIIKFEKGMFWSGHAPLEDTTAAFRKRQRNIKSESCTPGRNGNQYRCLHAYCVEIIIKIFTESEDTVLALEYTRSMMWTNRGTSGNSRSFIFFLNAARVVPNFHYNCREVPGSDQPHIYNIWLFFFYQRYDDNRTESTKRQLT